MSYKIVSRTSGTIVHRGDGVCEILVSGESDLDKLPDDIAPGSTAHTVGLSQMWEKGLDGTWKSIGG